MTHEISCLAGVDGSLSFSAQGLSGDHRLPAPLCKACLTMLRFMSARPTIHQTIVAPESAGNRAKQRAAMQRLLFEMRLK